MMPLDDELRAVLSSRADALPPSTDPLAGIEARAGRLRRARRARVLGGAALVAVVGIGVPLSLTGTRATSPPVAHSPTAPPTSVLSPTVVAPSTGGSAAPRPAGALTWPSTPLTAEQRAAYLPLWSARHPGGAAVSGEVLFADTLPTGASVRVLQLWRAGGPAWVAFFEYAQGEPSLFDDTAVRPSLASYRAVVPGNETPYVVVVGAPGTTRVEYAADGVSFRESRPGRTAVIPRSGPTGTTPDLVRVLDAAGSAHAQPADAAATPQEPVTGVAEPTNLLSSWPMRGTVSEGPDLDEARAAFAAERGRPGARVGLRLLFAGSSDAGMRYLFGQAWLVGEAEAHTFGYATGGTAGPVPYLGPVTPWQPALLAYSVCCSPGATTDTLIVVPAPRIGSVEYAATSGAAFRPAGAGQDSLDGVVLLDRDRQAVTDRLRLLDGNGRTILTAPVPPLLCGSTGCD